MMAILKPPGGSGQYTGEKKSRAPGPALGQRDMRRVCVPDGKKGSMETIM